MQTGPACDADSCLSAKELEADIVSIVYQCTPTPVPLTSAWRWRLVLNDLAGELSGPGKSDDSSEIIVP
jgi:hypothetical protein